MFFLVSMLDGPIILPSAKNPAQSHMWFCQLGQWTPDQAGIDTERILKLKLEDWGKDVESGN